MLFLGATCGRDVLRTDFLIAQKVSASSILFLAGVYVSSISSCLGAMYGTPRYYDISNNFIFTFISFSFVRSIKFKVYFIIHRVLQSIALENVIPAIGILGKGRGPNKVPLYAMGSLQFSM